MRSVKLFLISLFIITIFGLVSSYGFAIILPPFTALPAAPTLAPGITPITPIAAPTLPFTPTFPAPAGGLTFWPTPLAPTVTPTLPVPGPVFPGVMWWGLTPTFPTFTPTVTPTLTPLIPTFTPTVTPIVTPTVAPTVPVAPIIPVAPTIPLIATAPAPFTVPLAWPTATFAPITTVPITGGALWPSTAVLPFI